MTTGFFIPYPFRPVVWTLSTMYRWSRMYSSKIGMAVIAAPAIICPYSEV
jgi:hypothetical protein